MIHCEHVESSVRRENYNLSTQLRHTQLDYEDSVKSRRELQERIKDLEYQLGLVSQDNNVLKRRNPYVLVLLDGDGLIVRLALLPASCCCWRPRAPSRPLFSSLTGSYSSKKNLSSRASRAARKPPTLCARRSQSAPAMPTKRK